MRSYLPFLSFIILLAAILVVCLPICNQPMVPLPAAENCATTNCSTPVPPAPPQTEFTQENWRFTAPGTDWLVTDPPVEEMKVLTKDDNQGCTVIFIKEETTDTYAQYVIATIRSFAQDGNIISSAKQVVLNNIRYVEAQVNTNETTVWMWITVQNGFGYNFGCGGDILPTTGSALHDLCQNIANTLEIK